MKRQLKYLYDKTSLKYPMYPIKYLFDIYRFKLLPETYVIRTRFKKSFGVKLDLKHPKTLNEKIQWLKLNDRTPLHTICADKFKVRSYVEEKIGEKYLVPLVFETKNVKDICERKMPDYPVIIKTNHDSSGGIIIKDKVKQDWAQIQKKLRNLLKRNYYYYDKEWQYKNIERRIIVEKLLISENGGIPFDYKVHCFNGKPHFIQVDMDRMVKHKRNLYTPQWEKIEAQLMYPSGKDVKRPTELNSMLELASSLAKEFIYARVDFYAIRNEIYFGEITFHPEGGYGNFSPREYDLKFGSNLKLPIDVAK
jgi:hypothetical protein